MGWIRQTHRWVSMVFMVAVMINVAALALQAQATWIGLLALAPLIFLMLSGLYLFVQPYAAKLKARRPSAS